MTPTDICNIALAEAATRTTINGFPPIDNTPAAVSANTFFTPKTRALLRGANWNFCRRQESLTLLRRAINADGTASSDPPSQPFQYEYLYPSAALKIRFIQQFLTTTTSGTVVPLTSASGATIYPAFANTRTPFVEAVDMSGGTPRKTLLTNMPDAMAIYTMDLSQYPDMWDALFTLANTAFLASYFVANLSGDKSMLQLQIGIAKSGLDSARGTNANESISNVDHIPDFIRARSQGSVSYGGGYGRGYCDWDQVAFPDGLFY
jgi:hypothetical protein